MHAPKDHSQIMEQPLNLTINFVINKNRFNQLTNFEIVFI